jgi:hypothetical protein
MTTTPRFRKSGYSRPLQGMPVSEQGMQASQESKDMQLQTHKPFLLRPVSMDQQPFYEAPAHQLESSVCGGFLQDSVVSTRKQASADGYTIENGVPTDLISKEWLARGRRRTVPTRNTLHPTEPLGPTRVGGAEKQNNQQNT